MNGDCKIQQVSHNQPWHLRIHVFPVSALGLLHEEPTWKPLSLRFCFGGNPPFKNTPVLLNARSKPPGVTDLLIQVINRHFSLKPAIGLGRAAILAEATNLTSGLEEEALLPLA